MGKFKVDQGLPKYLQKLNKLSKAEEEIIGHGVFEGARLMADAISEKIDAIPETYKRGTSDNPIKGLRPAQKKGLKAGFGIATMQKENGFWNVKCGFNGYNSAVSKRFPNGQPNAMVARSLERGTSFSVPIRFFSNAVRGAKASTQAIISETIENDINNTFGG